MGRKASYRNRILKRSISPKNARRSLLPDPFRARYPVRRVASQGDEIGHLPGIHPIALAHLSRTNAHHFASAHWLEDGRRLGRELIGVAVARCDNRGPAFPFLLRCGGRQKVVGLVTGSLGRREATSRHEVRQHGQLINQVIIEPAASLITLERFVPVSRGIERVPADLDGARPFAFVEPLGKGERSCARMDRSR